ncbi:PhoU domain-containing protein [Paraburkholderia sp. LEh10]|uniref:PhoU domain-containing protein n=1 Tax=Paraburkholderia sp. LEh10 TaxID=2821353 RepID=UPI003917CBB2
MDGLVQSQLNDAMEALSCFDMGLVEKVVDDEHRLNEMEVEIDAECGNISHGASAQCIRPASTDGHLEGHYQSQACRRWGTQDREVHAPDREWRRRHERQCCRDPVIRSDGRRHPPPRARRIRPARYGCGCTDHARR